MLPGEIEPFADHHIERLDAVKELLSALELCFSDRSTIDQIAAARNDLNNARNGFVRFKVCMVDEVKQKTRYAKYAKEHGYQYS